MTPADDWHSSSLKSRREDVHAANLESYTVINVIRIIIAVVTHARCDEGH